MIIAYVLRRRFHRKPILANRTPLEIEAHIIALSLEQPAFGQIGPIASDKSATFSCTSSFVAARSRIELTS